MASYSMRGVTETLDLSESLQSLDWLSPFFYFLEILNSFPINQKFRIVGQKNYDSLNLLCELIL